MTADQLPAARLLALGISLALLGGALASEYIGKLWPCDMCWWQRYPHGVAILLALGALVSPLAAPRTRVLTLLAALAIAAVVCVLTALGGYAFFNSRKWRFVEQL